jgi:hypothetical protein
LCPLSPRCRQAGRIEGRTEGRTEGRKEGREKSKKVKKGRKEGGRQVKVFCVLSLLSFSIHNEKEGADKRLKKERGKSQKCTPDTGNTFNL